MTERGQSEGSTLQGIQGEGTSTRSTGSLTGRTGVVTGSQVEEVFVEDEGVDKEILDDGGGPHKKMGESGGGGGGEDIEQCDGDGMTMTTVWRTMRTRTRFWRRTTGRDRRRWRRRRSNISDTLFG